MATPIEAAPSSPINPGPRKGDTEPPAPAWFQQACAEAVVDTQAAELTKTATRTSGSRAMKAVVVRADRLWANGTVLNYGFMDIPPLSDGQKNQQLKVKNVVMEWQKYANITFNPVEDLSSATIRITFDPNNGSWSFVGNEVSVIKTDQPTMNLGWVSGQSADPSPEETGVILHEFGHTLGLMHEHQSPARGDKITLKESAVIEFYTKTQGWTEQEVKDQIINVYNAQDISNYSEVDLKSIMEYFMPPELNVQGIRIDPNNKLSEIDKAFMLINYPLFLDTPNSPDLTFRNKFEAALDTVGVDGDEKTLILNLYDAHNWPEVRYEFTRWCTETRLARQTAPPAPAKPAADLKPEEVIPDGCVAEGIEGDPSDTAGTGALKGVSTVESDLWLPGETITYSWVQGTLDATDYRKSRVKQTLAEYAARANLKFLEVPMDPSSVAAKIHIYFGAIPLPGVAGWSKIGKQSVGYRQTQKLIDTLGGTVESSIVFNGDVVSKIKPTDPTAIVREQRVLYHELGHTLGLKHEHTSPNTKTTDTPDTNVLAATLYDETSVMLYANRKLRADTIWQQLRDFFDPQSTKFNHLPSPLDLAFLGALYPIRSGHVDDRLASDLKILGLTGTSATNLLTLRDQAFAVEFHDDFPAKISAYRQQLTASLNTLQATRAAAAAQQPAHAVLPPSNFKAARDAQINPPAKATTGSFLDELVKTLQAFFKPTTGQLFALQFPGRFLQQDLYAWDTNTAGIYGQFVKPTVVNESEFRLVDQLYNVGTVIGAPSGINLSIVYDQVLNNLVPGIQQSAINFSKQQDQIRTWLLKDVPTTGWVKDLIASQHTDTTTASPSGPSGAARAINASSAINPDSKPQFAVANKLSDDNKVNRMELADALMQEYLSAKQAWELERDDMIKNAQGQDMDALTRRLAHITTIREAQLASKHADAVVRGYSHVIRQYLGFMDIKSPAELLQDAKDALRESAVSSLDGSLKVYPVQMQPIDWFQSLSTSFTLEDLTVNQDIIAQQIDIKSKQIDVLNTRLAIIQSVPKTDLKELQDKLDAAQTAYDQAQADLSTTYTSNVISLAKTCINANNEFVMEDFVPAAKAARIADAAFDNIASGMKKLTTTQLAVTQSSRALTQLMAAKSLALASDTTQEVIETNVEITALTKDINELTTRLQALRYKPAPVAAPVDPTQPAAKPSIDDVDLYPPESTSSGGSRWQEIYMKHNVDNKYSASSDQSHAATSKTDVSLFFGSYHAESSESSATSTSTNTAQSVEVEVGFRATLVTVDRGGWFQPQFFKQSAGFHCIDQNITWSKWPANIKTVNDLSNDDGTAFTEINKGLLPAYPTGFVVCKDITIKIRISDTDIQSAGAEMEKFAASSAGILCWSTSSSESSSSSDKSYSFVQKSDGCVIRIPGPQIMGYILQFTDNDESTPIPDTLPDGFLLSDADYNASFAPAHAVDPNATTSTTTTTTNSNSNTNTAAPKS